MSTVAKQYSRKKSIVEQFRHDDATPQVLREMEASLVGGLQHIWQEIRRAADECEALRAENKRLKVLLREHGIRQSK